MSITDDKIVRGRGSMRGDGVSGPPPDDDVMVPIAVVTAGSDDYVRKITPDGNLEWEVDTGGTVRAVTSTPQATYYADDDETARRLDSESGNTVWSFSLSADGRSIAGDDQGFVYVGETDAFGSDGLRKLAVSDGTEDDSGHWPVLGGERVDACAIGPWGVYAGGNNNEISLFDFDNGDEVWSRDTGDVAWDAAVDPDGWVYVASRDGSVYAFDAANGEPKDGWPVSTGASQAYAVSTYKDGSILVGDSNGNAKRIGPNGTTIWTYDSDGSSIWSAATDPQGRAYIGTNSPTIESIGAEGEKRWRFEPYGGTVFEIEIIPGPYGAFPEMWL